MTNPWSPTSPAARRSFSSLTWPLICSLMALCIGCSGTPSAGIVVAADASSGDVTFLGGEVGSGQQLDGAIGTMTDTGGTATDDGRAGQSGVASVLRYAMPNGNKDDFGGQCKTLCKLTMAQNGLRKLHVQYLVDGVPKPDVLVQFIAKDKNNGLGEVMVENTVTDGNGVAFSVIKSGSKLGVFDVVATVPDDANATAKFFEMHVVSKAKGPLKITLHYVGSSNPFEYTHLKVRLAKQEPAGQPACKSIDLGLTPPTADNKPIKIHWESPSNLKWDQPWTVGYSIFPKWVQQEVEKTKTPVQFSVLGVARTKSGGPVRAAGCVDSGATVTWNPQTQALEGDDVLVIVKDIPPRLQGNYDMETRVDLLSILPPTAELVFKTVFDILTDPIAGVLSLACKLGGDTLGSFCGLIFDNPKNPSIKNLKQPFGAMIVKLLDGVLYGFLPESIKKGLTTGADIGQILTDLEMGGVIRIKKEPDASGFLGKEHTEDEWTSVTYKWSLGQNCNAKDPKCGKKTFPINAFQSKSIVGHFDLWRDAFKSELKIAEHGLLIKWGALINYIVQKQLLPAITADPNNPNAPVIDSYEKLIKSLLADKQCLVKDTCCEDFGNKLAKQQSLVKAGFLKGACEALTQLGSAFLEAQLNQLDADTNKSGGLLLSTEACPLFDITGNQYVDRIGAKNTPCDWNMTVKIDGKPKKMKATFYAIRQL